MTLKVLVPVEVIDTDHPALHSAKLFFPQAELYLLHVLASPSASRPYRAGMLGQVELLAQLEKQQVAEATLALSELGQGEVVVADSPARAILEYAGSGNFDLIWMGTAQKGTLERYFVGSVAEQVIRESRLPVVSVHVDSPVVGPKQGTGPRILMLHDFSPASNQALAFLRETFATAQIDLLHVVDAASFRAPMRVGVMPTGRTVSPLLVRSYGLEWQQKAQQRLTELGGGKVLRGQPADVALEHIQSGEYDLIALGKSDKGLLDRLMYGSNAAKIVRESSIPVLTVEAPEETP